MIRVVSIIGIATVVLAGVLMLPFEVPYAVSGVGILMPAQEWQVVRYDDGSVGTLLRDYVEGSVRSSQLHRFDRGDAVQYTLSSSLAWRTAVAEGDTILRIRSSEAERQAAALTGLVSAAESAVSLYASGEKEAVVDRAERNLTRAREEAELAGKEVVRLRQLAGRQLVSQQDLDAAESRLRVAEAEVAIAQAELEDVRSGAKQEQLQLARKKAEAHRSELAAVTDRLDQLTIRAPLSGLAVRSYGTDTLLTIRDTSAAVVMTPVPWKEAHHLETGQPVNLSMREVPVTFKGRVIQLGDTVHRLQRRQVMMVTVLVEHPPDAAVAGAAARCKIDAGAVRLFEYVRRRVL